MSIDIIIFKVVVFGLIGGAVNLAVKYNRKRNNKS